MRETLELSTEEQERFLYILNNYTATGLAMVLHNFFKHAPKEFLEVDPGVNILIKHLKNFLDEIGMSYTPFNDLDA